MSQSDSAILEKLMCYRTVTPTMNVRVVRGKDENAMSLPEGATVESLCSALGLLIDAHIVLRNNVPIPSDEVLRDGDIVRVIKVASGG